MAFNDSTVLSPVFIDSECDWGKPVLVIARHRTDIQTMREGSEQRARRRARPRYATSFMLSGLPTLDFAQRRAKALKELGRPVVVPIWPAPLTLVSMPNADQASFNPTTLALKKFKVGSWAYFVQTGNVSTFRKITGIGSTFLDLHATDAFPVPPIPAFTAGALVYPCVLGRRFDNAAAFEAQRLNVSNEEVSVEEL